MQKSISIFVKTSFEGFHKYVDAPEEVSYLRQLHRHIFGVEVELSVTHNNRDLEFIIVKHHIEDFLKNTYKQGETYSCEQIADDVCKHLIDVYNPKRVSCLITEDGENGGRVVYDN